MAAKLRVFAVSLGQSPSTTTTSEPLQAALRRLSGTTLEAQGAANIWAGTTGLELLGALNTKAGNPRGQWVGLEAVLNQLAGTTGLGVQAAAGRITS